MQGREDALSPSPLHEEGKRFQACPVHHKSKTSMLLRLGEHLLALAVSIKHLGGMGLHALCHV